MTTLIVIEHVYIPHSAAQVDDGRVTWRPFDSSSSKTMVMDICPPSIGPKVWKAAADWAKKDKNHVDHLGFRTGDTAVAVSLCLDLRFG